MGKLDKYAQTENHTKCDAAVQDGVVTWYPIIIKYQGFVRPRGQPWQEVQGTHKSGRVVQTARVQRQSVVQQTPDEWKGQRNIWHTPPAPQVPAKRPSTLTLPTPETPPPTPLPGPSSSTTPSPGTDAAAQWGSLEKKISKILLEANF